MTTNEAALRPAQPWRVGGKMCSNRQSRELSLLLDACAKGDRNAFRQVYDLSARYVFGITLSMMQDRELASDIAQETFVRIWRRAAQFDVERGNALAWIGSIARNCAIDRLRADRVRGFVQLYDAVPEIADSPDPAAQMLDKMMISAVLDDIRPNYRRALLLCYFQGYTYEELADALEIPVGTAKSWVRRGLMALRDRMT